MRGAFLPQLNLFLLGSPRIERDGQLLNLDIRKGLALLAYLAVEQIAHSREELATFFWPDQDQARARAALRNALWGLNKVIGNQWLIANRESIQLDLNTNVWVDATAFTKQLPAHQTKVVIIEADDCSTAIPLLTEAVSLYQADFMSGFTLRDSPDFDAWQALQASHLRQDFARALERLVDCYISQGELEAALPYARRWVEFDPLHEPAQRQLMQLYVQTGQRTEALRQFLACEQLLADALDVTPSAKTMALHAAIQAETKEIDVENESGKRMGARHNANTTSPIFVAEQSLLPPTNLPTPTTTFIGRKQALLDIAERLANPDCRLLTLIGAGGIGKTRLTIQAANDALDTANSATTPAKRGRFVQGVFFISLSSSSTLDDAVSHLVSTIIDTLKITFYDLENNQDLPHAQLLHHLRDKQMLLVIDNFEHHLEAADLLTDILTQAPHVKILVTSRERLNLQGEWIYEVLGLGYPKQKSNAPSLLNHPVQMNNEAKPITFDTIKSYSAIQLFEQSAQRSDPNFVLTNQEWNDVIRICQLVEGMPLAIELAASWVRVLSLSEIWQEISSNLDFLTTALRDLPERHRNLRVVFEGSWQLLTADEKTALKHMSVFRRGFRREAAEAITGATLATVSALVDKSLLSKRPAPQMSLTPRYEMHSVIRQYAADKLSPVEEVAVQTKHGHYYARFLKTREADLRGKDQTHVITEISIEMANIRTAWRWAVTHQPKPDLGAIGQALDSLYHFYETRSRFQGGQDMFKQAVQRVNEVWPEPSEQNVDVKIVYGRLLARQGVFANALSHHSTGQLLLQQSLDLFRQLPTKATADIAFSLNHLGNIAFALAQYAEAEQYYRKSLTRTRTLDDQYGIAVTLNNMGKVATFSGDYEQAYRYSFESLSIGKKLENQWCIAFAHHNLGQIANARGDYAKARQHYQQTMKSCQAIGERALLAATLDQMGNLAAETTGNNDDDAKQLLTDSLALHKEIGNKRGIASSLNDLGKVAFQAGNYREAQSLLMRSLNLCRTIDDHYGVILCLDNLGYVAEAQGQDQKAIEYFQEALIDALDINATPLALDTLVGFATLLVKKTMAQQQHRKNQAAELLIFVAKHPASEQETRQNAERLLTQLLPKHRPLETSALPVASQADLNEMANRVNRLFS